MSRVSIEDFLKVSGVELVRRYGARKVGDTYEIDVLHVPWTLGPWPVHSRIERGRDYFVGGIKVEGKPLGDIYVVFIGDNGNVGFVHSERKPMFKCIRVNYTYPIGIQLPNYISIKPLPLVLSDSRYNLLGECIDMDMEVKGAIVLVTYVEDLYNMHLKVDGLALYEG